MAALLLAGCAGGSGPGDPAPDDSGVLRPLQVYRQLGMLAGPEQFPIVASFATMAGPADSAYVVFAVSLPNSALRFQREESGFIGRYMVSLAFAQDSQTVREVKRDEVVRVPTFAETGRTDESVVFQTVVPLAPGRYTVNVEVRDGSGGRGLKTQDTLDVPAYRSGGARLSTPVVVYRGEGRASPEAAPELILNPRHTVPYGGDAPRVYVEAYGAPVDHPVRIRVLGQDSAELWQSEVRLQEGDDRVRHAVVEIPASSLPLGRHWIEAAVNGDSAASARTPLVVSISDQWMVANFEEVLEFLRYIASGAELDSLREVTGAERTARWERFWERRDPVPATPANEYREEFFERIRVATMHFGEPGRPGWRTDRGEVFIVLGPPDHVVERHTGRRDMTARPNAIDWVYERGPSGRLGLTFIDTNGFERFELTSSSRAAFRAAAARVRRSQ